LQESRFHAAGRILLLLVPVLYVNQEMVLRLGTVTGVGHARLILERFGRFWGAFSVIDLFLLNSLTIVTEFIGISLALDYLGLSRELGVIASAAIIIAAAGTGDFRRFEQFSLLLVFGSLLLIPVFIWVHPPISLWHRRNIEIFRMQVLPRRLIFPSIKKEAARRGPNLFKTLGFLANYGSKPMISEALATTINRGYCGRHII
jgi:Mn2+/Fe2+ NRAMP family transporter